MLSRELVNAAKQSADGYRSPVSGAGRPVRTRRKLPDRRPLLYPLNWWRTRPASDFKKVDVAIVRHCLARTGVIGEPHWYLAVAGDAAIAVGVALRVQRRGMSPLLLDVAMTAVLAVAIEGDTAAGLLISALVHRFEASGYSGKSISDSWLTHPSKLRPCARRPPLRGAED